jgi:hypothetical protein
MIQVSGTDLVYFFQLETKIHLVETYRVQHNIVELTPVIPLVEDRKVLDKVAHLVKCMGLSNLINNSPPQDLDILFSRVGDLAMGSLIGLPSKVVQIQALDSLRVLDKMHLQWVVSEVGEGGQQQQRQQGFGQFPVQNGGFSSATGFEGQTMPTSYGNTMSAPSGQFSDKMGVTGGGFGAFSVGQPGGMQPAASANPFMVSL